MQSLMNIFFHMDTLKACKSSFEAIFNKYNHIQKCVVFPFFFSLLRNQIKHIEDVSLNQ